MRIFLIATLLTFSFNLEASTLEEYNPENKVFSDPKLIEMILMQKQSNSKSLILELKDIYNCLNTSHTIRKVTWKAVAYVQFRFDLFSEDILKTHSSIAVEIYKSHLTDETPLYKNLVEAQPNIRQQIGQIDFNTYDIQRIVMCELMGDDSAIKTHISSITCQAHDAHKLDELYSQLDALIHLGSEAAFEHQNWLRRHIK